jgi:hypothetical protein
MLAKRLGMCKLPPLVRPCAECQAQIIGDLGKLIITEIPQDVTQPGLPRAFYQGQARVESYVNEAHRSVASVVFLGDPPTNAQDAAQSAFQPGHYPDLSLASSVNGAISSSLHSGEPSQSSPGARDSDMNFPGLRPIESEPGFGSFMGIGSSSPPPNVDEFGTVAGPTSPYSQTLPSSSFRAGDADSINSSSTPTVEAQNSQIRPGGRGGPAGSRFATFPVKRPTMDSRGADDMDNGGRRPSVGDNQYANMGGSRTMSPPPSSAPIAEGMGGPPRPGSGSGSAAPLASLSGMSLSLPNHGAEDTSFASSIAQAMGGEYGGGLNRAPTLSQPPAYTSTDGHVYAPPAGPPPGHSSPSTGTFSHPGSPTLPPGAAPPKAMTAPPPPPHSAEGMSYDPMARLSNEGAVPERLGADTPASVPPPQLEMPTPSTQPTPIAEAPEPLEEHEPESQLAYMSDPEEQPQGPPAASVGRSKSKRVDRDEHGNRISRHVKFGEVSDIDDELEQREMERGKENLTIDTRMDDSRVGAPLG